MIKTFISLEQRCRDLIPPIYNRLDYASQLWSPHTISQITQIEKVQRSFTKHIAGLRDVSYHERLQTLKLYSLQRRRERYCIILIWKIIDNRSQNLSDRDMAKCHPM